MQSATRQGFELRETIEEIAVRVSGRAGDVVQLFHVSRTNTEGEHRRACIFQEIGRGTWIAAVAEAVGYQKYHLVRRLAAFLENRLVNNAYLLNSCKLPLKRGKYSKINHNRFNH